MHQQLKHCPLCNDDLPIDEFGISRARRDGRNLYCKPCIRAKVTIARRNLKEYKATRKRVVKEKYWAQLNAGPTVAPVVVRSPKKKLEQSPVERIRELIRKKPRTQRELKSKTKLDKEVIGEVLATLLLWNHEIRSVWIGDERVYFFVEQKPAPVVERKPSVLGGLRSVCALLEQRKAG